MFNVQTGAGFYFRSTPVATFNFESGNYSVPLGVGVGKVAIVGRTILNFFVEPQYTFLSHGPNQPLFQVYSGINAQLKL